MRKISADNGIAAHGNPALALFVNPEAAERCRRSLFSRELRLQKKKHGPCFTPRIELFNTEQKSQRIYYKDLVSGPIVYE